MTSVSLTPRLEAINSIKKCAKKIDRIESILRQKCDEGVYCPMYVSGKKVTGITKLGVCDNISCSISQAKEQNERYRNYLKTGRWRGISGESNESIMTDNNTLELSLHINRFCDRQTQQIEELMTNIQPNFFKKIWIFLKENYIVLIIVITIIILFVGYLRHKLH